MFSVVITTKNRLYFLKRAIQSIELNTVVPSEVIIVNDGGFVIDDSIITTKLNLIIINNKISKGANFCRNQGIKKSTTEINFLLDDDDYFLSNSFESRLVGFADKDVGISYTGIKIVSTNDLTRYLRTVIPKTKISQFDLIKHGNLIGSTSRVALRKKFFLKVGGFDENLYCLQDYDLWIRMSAICDVHSDDRATVIYTIHDSKRQVSTNYKKYYDASQYLIQKFNNLHSSFNISDDFKSNLYLRIALSASSTSLRDKNLYSFLSFYYKPNPKAFIVFICPFFILRNLFHFV